MAFAYGGDIGQNSVFGIINAERSSGIPMSVTSTVRTGGGTSLHDSGNAVDFSDGTDTANEAKLAQWIMDNYGASTAELIHSGGKGYFIKNGTVVPASFYSSVLAAHHNHVHWAITNSGLKAKGPVSGASDLSGNIGDASILGGLLDPILGPIKALVDFTKQLVKLFQFFTDPHNWWRIAEFILGCGLLYLGVRGLNLAAVNAVTKPADQVFKSAKRTVKKANGAVKSDVAKKPAVESKLTGSPNTPTAAPTGKPVANAAAKAIKDTVG